MNLSMSIRWCLTAGIVVAAPIAAYADPLKVVEVAAPAINCVFKANCIVLVTDTVAPIPFNVGSGSARLQSRTFTAAASGVPGAGTTAYLYRVDMTKMIGTECVTGMTIDFGAIKPLPYKNNALAHVFVITQGGLGKVSLKSAEQFGNIVVFEFKPNLCVPATTTSANSSTFFIGMASGASPKASVAHLLAIGQPALYELAARVPQH